MIKVERGKLAELHFSFAGSRPAMTRFVLAPFWITVLPFDLRYATPILPVARGRPVRDPLDRFPNKRSMHLANRPPASKSLYRLTHHLPRPPAVSSLEGLRTPAPVSAAPPSWGGIQDLHRSGHTLQVSF